MPRPKNGCGRTVEARLAKAVTETFSANQSNAGLLCFTSHDAEVARSVPATCQTIATLPKHLSLQVPQSDLTEHWQHWHQVTINLMHPTQWLDFGQLARRVYIGCGDVLYRSASTATRDWTRSVPRHKLFHYIDRSCFHGKLYRTKAKRITHVPHSMQGRACWHAGYDSGWYRNHLFWPFQVVMPFFA